MKKLEKIFSLICVLFCIFICASCETEVHVDLKKDGTVALKFNGEFGEGLAKLVNSVSEDDAVFDTKAISYELSKSGFSDVIVSSRGKRALEISMNEKGQNSYLFTSGLCKTENNKLQLNFTPVTLSKFYSLCDEQILMYLDLLLAPIFNDEKMSEDEYLETLAAFYGQSVADEFKNSTLKVVLSDFNGKKTTSVISVAKLLTLDEAIIIE